MIRSEVKDPRIGFVSITRVEVSRDLAWARVYVSHLGTAEEAEASMAGLKSAAAYLRGEIARRLKLRLAPRLDFLPDHSIADSLHIQALIKTLPPEAGDE